MDEKYVKYKQFASRHNSNQPKLDPLVSKRLQNEKRDARNLPDLENSYSRVSLGKVSQINKQVKPMMKKSGSVPSILAPGGPYTFREYEQTEKRIDILEKIEGSQDELNSQILQADRRENGSITQRAGTTEMREEKQLISGMHSNLSRVTLSRHQSPNISQTKLSASKMTQLKTPIMLQGMD